MVKDFILIKGSDISQHQDGTSFQIGDLLINLKLLGAFNALNASLAYAIGLNQDFDNLKIKEGLENVTSLAGKLELVRAGQDFIALVDYSFEPRAMEKLYQTVSLLPHNKIIHLLGSAGGGRDKSRRPILGEMAGQKADIVIVSNEDPYDEDPQLIIDQVAIGVEKAGKILNKDLFKILDRREAIKKAISLANAGDLVLFTGKGAEQHICISSGKKIFLGMKERL
jgi:UDP-N-acetylmuramyl tripeptide synthase